MPNLVAERAKSNVNIPFEIQVFNSRTEQSRTLMLRPSNNWGGAGLLGCAIRFADFQHASSLVWHVVVPFIPDLLFLYHVGDS